MKKISLICATLLASISLSACKNHHSNKSNKSNISSGKVIKQHRKKHSKKEKSQNIKESKKISENASNQADPFDASTWNKPYKGYPNFYAYMHDHPDTPNIQSQTAKMQHDENLRLGIEDANGNETQNFKNWEAYRDRTWSNGETPGDYDQHIDYSTRNN